MFLRVVIAIFVLVSALLTTMATPVANASVAPTEPSHVAVAWNPCAGKSAQFFLPFLVVFLLY